MELASETGKHFSWLTCTNRGAAEVCEAALRVLEVTQEELDWGYACDPTSKSRLRIVATKGVLLRLTRNFDKTRGFVNGALVRVFEDLGNGVIIAQLIESGNMVLIHQIEEKGRIFLPCCYGYATTIRRAQGASLDYGCLYFDQKKDYAGRGFAQWPRIAACDDSIASSIFLYPSCTEASRFKLGDLTAKSHHVHNINWNTIA